MRSKRKPPKILKIEHAHNRPRMNQMRSYQPVLCLLMCQSQDDDLQQYHQIEPHPRPPSMIPSPSHLSAAMAPRKTRHISLQRLLHENACCCCIATQD